MPSSWLCWLWSASWPLPCRRTADRGSIRWRLCVMNDLKFAFRQLLKNPGFTAVAVLTLALGIGANTAIFSVVNAVLLKPLAYREPGRIVTLLYGGRGPVAPADFLDWRAQS